MNRCIERCVVARNPLEAKGVRSLKEVLQSEEYNQFVTTQNFEAPFLAISGIFKKFLSPCFHLAKPTDEFAFCLTKPNMIRLYTRFDILKVVEKYIISKIKSYSFQNWLNNYYYNDQDNYEDKIVFEIRRVLGNKTLDEYSVAYIDYKFDDILWNRY